MNKALSWIEEHCTIEHQGRHYTAGGAVVADTYVIAYVGEVIPGGTVRQLTDWHGNVIGSCRITATWRTPRSFLSDTMSQVYATVARRRYTGRSAGPGTIFRGRLIK